MKKIILFIAILFSCVSAQAQKQTWNWTFGVNNGLTWNTDIAPARSIACIGQNGIPNATLTGLPAFLPNVALNTAEGCFSLSDKNGNLLFYSDGITVYNKINQPMDNGSDLGGNASSAQSGVVAPYPGHPNQYIAFSIGINLENRASYSIVDMTLNGGLGDVLNPKAVRLTGGRGVIGESAMAVRHANGKDYWLIATGKGYPTYMNAWLVTSSGVSSSPVTSQITIATRSVNTIGCYLKLSPDGKHFVWGVDPASETIFGDFDSSTGQFSNARTFSYVNVNTADTYGAYGLEFSNSGKYLYVNYKYAGVFAYDFDLLLKNTASAVTNRKYVCSLSDIGAAQMGPDGRIYLSNYENTDFAIIANPEEFNSLKVYKTPTGFVQNKAKSQSLGLPTFSSSWFSMDDPIVKNFTCSGYTYKFETKVDIMGSLVPVKLNVDYGDGTTETINLVAGKSDYNFTHIYATAATYTVTITPVRADGTTVSPSIVNAEVIDCSLRSNRMIRLDLQNANMQTDN